MTIPCGLAGLLENNRPSLCWPVDTLSTLFLFVSLMGASTNFSGENAHSQDHNAFPCAGVSWLEVSLEITLTQKILLDRSPFSTGDSISIY